jgi:D-aminoacyl-tRNA deacylase
MKALLQRVKSGFVTVDGVETGRIGPGLVVFLGVGRDDGECDADYLARRVAELRVFPRDEAEFDLSVLGIGGGVLAVSQFTLMADTRKGRRPSWVEAAPPSEALPLYERFVAALRTLGLEVATGVFQAYMQVELVNDGPVTILLESKRVS